LSNRWIRTKRKSLGLTQHELAKKSGVTFARLSYGETGRIQLTPDEIERIEEVFRARAQRVFDAVMVG
jgi:transcriptional regulator with XRE-family HTH domain